MAVGAAAVAAGSIIVVVAAAARSVAAAAGCVPGGSAGRAMGLACTTAGVTAFGSYCYCCW